MAGSTTARRHRARSCRPPTSSSGATISFVIVFVPDLEVRLARRSRRAWTPAPSGSAPTSSRPKRPGPRPRASSPTYQAQLADAKQRVGRIIEEARQTADAMKRDLQAQAEADIAAMRQKAAADIEAAKAQAMADLRGEVATLAIGAAERVVEHNLDRETNKALVESYIDQVGAGGTDGRAGRPHRSGPGVRRGALRRSRRPKATARRSRTSCSASPGSSRAPTSCARRSPTRTSRSTLRQQIVEDLLGGKARPATTNLVACWSATAGCASCPASSTAWSS